MTTSQASGQPSGALPLGYRLGEYQIEAVLGRGGFGITYRARDTKLGADVAIKEYFPQIYALRANDATIAPRPGADLENYRWGLSEFLKEAQALARFKHPHIVRVLRYLEANGTAYTVMEYEEGETLSGFLRKHGGLLDEPTLLRLFFPVLGGLQAVHDAGLLHLDIKPDNIYLRRDGQPMLIDFGSARQIRTGIDEPQKVMLTQGFCALEQYPGHGDAGPWSDVYGMGATLYRCVTGKNPTDALERHTTFERSRIDPLRPATSFERPFYRPHIRQCVDAALNLAPGERPSSAFALQQGLLGKDMSKIEKRGPDVMFRPGSGFIGVIPGAAPQEQKRRRRRTLVEKMIATLVFVAAMAVVVPKILLDTGELQEVELYDMLDDARVTLVEGALDLRDFVNERVFGKQPTPRTLQTAAVRRPHKPEPPPEPVPEAPPPPFGSDKQKMLEIRMPDIGLRAVAFLKHGTILATATEDGLVRLWDTQTGEPRKTVPVQVHTPAALGVYPSSQWFAATDQYNQIGIWDPLGNREAVLRPDPPHPVTAIAVANNDRLLAEATDGGVVTIWDLSRNRPLLRLPERERAVQVLAFSPDDRLLVAGSASGALTTWQTSDGKAVAHRRAHKHPVTALAFSPDGRWFASGSAGGELRLTPVADESAARLLNGAPPAIREILFSPDGQWLMAAGSAKVVRVWNVETGDSVHEIHADSLAVRAIAATRDGKFLAIAGDDQVVRLWK